jgi:hypothetical protein
MKQARVEGMAGGFVVFRVESLRSLVLDAPDDFNLCLPNLQLCQSVTAAKVVMICSGLAWS